MSSSKDIKLLAFDLDGTLVTDDKRLTERTRRALQAASDSGIETVIATGRPITAVPEEIKGQPCFRYAVSTDGARIEDLQSGKILHQAFIPQRLVRPIYEIFDHYDVVKEIYIDGTGYISEPQLENLRDYVPNQAVHDYILRTRRVVPDIRALMDQDIEKAHALFKTEEDRRDAIRRFEETGEGLSLSDAFPINLEVSAPGVDKGAALKILGEMLGITTAQMMAFGDSTNDAAMFAAVGTSVCMANGNPKMKEQADIIAPSNEEDGVAQVIEKYVLGPDCQ